MIIIKKGELYEISLVLIPANPHCIITSINKEQDNG